MPTIGFFRGIKVAVQFDDHVPPYIHVQYGEHKATILIKEIELDEGFLPRKQLRLVLAWCELHQEELMENWELASQKSETFMIEPLK